jgi:hypothetical protein
MRRPAKRLREPGAEIDEQFSVPLPEPDFGAIAAIFVGVLVDQLLSRGAGTFF